MPQFIDISFLDFVKDFFVLLMLLIFGLENILEGDVLVLEVPLKEGLRRSQGKTIKVLDLGTCLAVELFHVDASNKLRAGFENNDVVKARVANFQGSSEEKMGDGSFCNLGVEWVIKVDNSVHM